MEALWFLFCRSAADKKQEVDDTINEEFLPWGPCHSCSSKNVDTNEVIAENKSDMVSVFTTAAAASAESAIDSALDEMNDLRLTLKPHGYQIKEVEVALSVIPSIRLTIAMDESSCLDNIDEDGLTRLQLLVVNALRKKVLIESTLARHKMVFSTLKIDLGMNPLVKLVLRWRPDADLDEDEDDEPERERP
jgi:hypothetical protein